MYKAFISFLITYSFLLNVIAVNRCVDTSSISEKQSTDKIKWAIVALTKPNKSDLEIRNSALAQKIKPYSSNHDITVIFFSEVDFPNDIQEKLVEEFTGIAKVSTINTANNGFNNKERYGYKYMCKFFALDIYEYLKQYDFYMRCDSDCYIKSMKYDVFDWIEKNNIEYAYALRKLEAHGPTRQQLPTWIDKYNNRCSITPTAAMDYPLTTCFNFYNNFHIGKVSFFLRPDVQDFLRAVNSSGHIINDRWGDSTIQAYAVRLFMDPQRITFLPNFSYIHGSHSNKIISTFDDGKSTNIPQKLPLWKNIN